MHVVSNLSSLIYRQYIAKLPIDYTCNNFKLYVNI